MSDEQFVEWLRESGMTQSGDRDKITGINKSRVLKYQWLYCSVLGKRPLLGKCNVPHFKEVYMYVTAFIIL